jgi:hypothetical protein
VLALCLGISACAVAQIPPFLPVDVLTNGATLQPASRTSADNLRLTVKDTTCGKGYTGNPYRVRVVQNGIIVTLGQVAEVAPPSVCPATPDEKIDLGQLPAGSYTLTVNYATGAPMFSNYPFVVLDARVSKSAPWVRLDYSGHWWDPADPGWGLFIWQDATDNLLAAWFTYTPDGRPLWYVFQPQWETNTVTQIAVLATTTRIAGPISPPQTTGTPAAVGTAKLDFTNNGTADEGKIIYTFNGASTLTRTIKRFKP